MTKRNLKTRIKEHEKDLQYNRYTTALVRLAQIENINVNFQQARIIAAYTNDFITKFKETTEILNRKQEICNDNVSTEIPLICKEMFLNRTNRWRHRN